VVWRSVVFFETALSEIPDSDQILKFVQSIFVRLQTLEDFDCPILFIFQQDDQSPVFF